MQSTANGHRQTEPAPPSLIAPPGQVSGRWTAGQTGMSGQMQAATPAWIPEQMIGLPSASRGSDDGAGRRPGGVQRVWTTGVLGSFISGRTLPGTARLPSVGLCCPKYDQRREAHNHCAPALETLVERTGRQPRADICGGRRNLASVHSILQRQGVRADGLVGFGCQGDAPGEMQLIRSSIELVAAAGPVRWRGLVAPLTQDSRTIHH